MSHRYPFLAFQYHCTLPTSEIPPTALAFDPASPQTLLLGFPNNTLQIFDVETRQYPECFKPLCSTILPSSIDKLNDPLAGISFLADGSSNPSRKRNVVLWGSSWLVRIDLAVAAQYSIKKKNTGREKWHFNKKRKQPSGTGGPVAGGNSALANGADKSTWNSPFNVIRKYREMLMVDFLGEGEMVVVERPIIDVLQTLPPAYFKARYGSG